MLLSSTVLALLLTLLPLATAHSKLTHLHIAPPFLNSYPITETTCLRTALTVNPQTNLFSPFLACPQTTTPYPSIICTTPVSSTLGFEYRTYPNLPHSFTPTKTDNDGKIQKIGVTDWSHKGPCAVYIKPVSSASTAVAEGDGWSKIYYEGVGEDGRFCTDRLREGDLPLEVKLPRGLADGDYLIRAELLTLNAASGELGVPEKNEPQFYVGCAQIRVVGGDGTKMAELERVRVMIPGYIKGLGDKGLLFNIWEGREKWRNYPGEKEVFGGRLAEMGDGQDGSGERPYSSAEGMGTNTTGILAPSKMNDPTKKSIKETFVTVTVPVATITVTRKPTSKKQY